jgi:hypothetical protein
MSDPAAPWWADVQHLRPREDRASEQAEPRRFHRPVEADEPRRPAGVATLEHEIPASWDGPAASWDGPATWGDDGATAGPAWHEEDAAWLETLSAPADPAPSRVWDAALEEAFARTPSWAEEDDERLLPKGAHRIENGRRTIEIRGQVDRIVGITAPAETAVATRSGRRRPTRRPAERLAGRPDRVAMWAFLLGVLLIVIAALSEPGEAAAAVPALVALF